MYTKPFSVLVALSVVAAAAKTSLKIDAPSSVSQCQPFDVSWSGGEGPYHCELVPEGGSQGAAHAPQKTSAMRLTWKPQLQKGQKFTVRVTDKAGNSVKCQPVTVINGPDDCLGDSMGGDGIIPGDGIGIGPDGQSVPLDGGNPNAPFDGSGSDGSMPDEPSGAMPMPSSSAKPYVTGHSSNSSSSGSQSGNMTRTTLGSSSGMRTVHPTSAF
ncbi:hypothetical protein CBS9595_002240 [Malassezia furfur]|nr:hypothetical protein CBS9595_002240 [Malassezia furfur]